MMDDPLQTINNQPVVVIQNQGPGTFVNPLFSTVTRPVSDSNLAHRRHYTVMAVWRVQGGHPLTIGNVSVFSSTTWKEPIDVGTDKARNIAYPAGLQLGTGDVVLAL